MPHQLDGLTAAEVIRLLELKPHPEGGHYRETFRDPDGPEGRGHSTAIYYLLRRGEISRWHRVDASESWHWYMGDPLELSIAEAGGVTRKVLGHDLLAGERPPRAVVDLVLVFDVVIVLQVGAHLDLGDRAVVGPHRREVQAGRVDRVVADDQAEGKHGSVASPAGALLRRFRNSDERLPKPARLAFE